MQINKLQSRQQQVGGLPIARPLPNKSIRTIGAWCFLDHAGPIRFQQAEQGLVVGCHPHCNLQTFTWVIEGEVLHRDSLGSHQIIRPNEVNLMTAGTGLSAGICHTEESVISQNSAASQQLDMLQLWIALPMEKSIKANFEHYCQLPKWLDNGINFTLATGSYTTTNGETFNAPTQQYTKLIGLDINFNSDTQYTLQLEKGFEYGLFVVSGSVEIQNQTFNQNELAYFNELEKLTHTSHCKIQAKAGTRLFLLGGEPLQHKVLLWWNFAANNKEELKKSVEDWNHHHARFGDINTSLERIPAPALPENFKA